MFKELRGCGEIGRHPRLALGFAGAQTTGLRVRIPPALPIPPVCVLNLKKRKKTK